MKKIKILLVLICFLIIPKAYASTTTFERNEANNYGVKKKWNMSDSSVSYYAKKTPYVDASEKIYDFADILTDEEEKSLYDRINTLIGTYNMDIVILTYSLPYSTDSQNEDFACDFYDFNDFGLNFSDYSGVLLFRNTYSVDPYFDMYSFGEAQQYLTPSRMSNILDIIYDDLHYSRYLSGFNKWIDEVKYYRNKGKEEHTYIDEQGLLRYEKYFKPYIGVNLLISSIVTLIFILVNVKKNKMVALATEASAYLNKESFKLNNSSDRLINSVTTSWTEPEHNYSSGGGHSSIGHSGGGHSSGGGRHG